MTDAETKLLKVAIQQYSIASRNFCAAWANLLSRSTECDEVTAYECVYSTMAASMFGKSLTISYAKAHEIEIDGVNDEVKASIAGEIQRLIDRFSSGQVDSQVSSCKF